VAQIEFSRTPWWSKIPLLGQDRPQFEKHLNVSTGSLKVKEADRSLGGLRGLLGHDEFGMNCGGATGDKVVVDTGRNLVQIQSDRLNLNGVRKGDEVDFQLDSDLDPGAATRVKGKVVAAIDGATPTKAQIEAIEVASRKTAARIEQPLDVEEPVSDLIGRRAMLFNQFKQGELDQDSLRDSWDSLRQEALTKVVAPERSRFQKQADLQQLLDIGAFSPKEARDLGIEVVRQEFGDGPGYLST